MKWLYLHETYSFLSSFPSDSGAYLSYGGYLVEPKYHNTAHGRAMGTIDQATFTFHDTFADYQNVDGSLFPSWHAILVDDTFTIPTPPDFRITMNSATGGILEPGGFVTINYTLTNAGGTRAGPSTVGVYLSNDATIDASDQLLTTISTAALGSNMYYQVTAPISTSSISAGPHYIGVIADIFNAVPNEASETNNRSNGIRIFGPSPELRATMVSATPGTVADTGKVDFTFNLFNSGTVASSSSHVGLYLSNDATISTSDTLLLDVDFGSLAAHSTNTIKFGSLLTNFYQPVVAGQRYFGVIIDYDNRVTEANETNNASQGVLVTVTGNHAPVAVDDAASTLWDTTKVIRVLANDSDAEHDALSITSLTAGPGHGSAVINVDGTISYTPTKGWLGKDTFGYAISDGHGHSDTATVTVNTVLGRKVIDLGTLTSGDHPIAISGGDVVYKFHIADGQTLFGSLDIPGMKWPHGRLTAINNPDPTLWITHSSSFDTGVFSPIDDKRLFEDPLMPGDYTFEFDNTSLVAGTLDLRLEPDKAGNTRHWAKNLGIILSDGTNHEDRDFLSRVDDHDVYRYMLTEDSAVAVTLMPQNSFGNGTRLDQGSIPLLTQYAPQSANLGARIWTSDGQASPLKAGTYFADVAGPIWSMNGFDQSDRNENYRIVVTAWADHAGNRASTAAKLGALGPRRSSASTASASPTATTTTRSR